MNTKQLWSALMTNKLTYNYFDGIYSKDTLSDIINKPQLIICNTDNSNKPGEHWVLFFFSKKKCEFYDSLGKDITFYGDSFLKFIYKFVTKIEQVPFRTQPLNTPYCGELCLFYAYKRCKGYKMIQILEMMSNIENVLSFVYDKFHICEDSKCQLLQRSQNK